MPARTRASRLLRTSIVIGLTVSVLHLPAEPVAGAATGPAAPTHLTVNGMSPATGVEPGSVAFAWRVADDAPGARQAGYRVLVARARDPRSDSSSVVWDSGTVTSGQQAFVPYRGPRLKGDTQLLVDGVDP